MLPKLEALVSVRSLSQRSLGEDRDAQRGLFWAFLDFSKFFRDLVGCLRVQQVMTVKQEVTLRLVSVMTSVSLLTFGALVETYKLLS